MPPVGFEPTISAGERLQTYALDRTATGTGKRQDNKLENCCIWLVIYLNLNFLLTVAMVDVLRGMVFLLLHSFGYVPQSECCRLPKKN